MSSFSRINLTTDQSRVSIAVPRSNVNTLPQMHMGLRSPSQQQQQPQQQLQQLQRQFQPQPFIAPPLPTSHPAVQGTMPSQDTQGVYTTYRARLTQSEDNALLLPSSYLRKKSRFGDSGVVGSAGNSDDDFEEDSDGESRTATPIRSRREAASAAAAGAAAVPASTAAQLALQEQQGNIDNSDSLNAGGGIGINGNNLNSSGSTKPVPVGAAKEFMNLPKSIRTKNHIYPSQQELDHAASICEILVPIRLDIDLDDGKLRDVFLWNMNEQFLTPEKFGEMLCQDLDLEPYRYAPVIADSIRNQVMDFETIHDIELPMENYIRVIINLDLQVGKVNLRDRFEWDLNNTMSNAPEIFSRKLATDLGLGGEYVPIISHAIREQLYRHKRQMVDDYVTEGGITEPLSSAFRNVENANSWTPQMEVLSNEELEKLLIAQERNIRRLRRENRFKRSRRRGS